jgi:curved DNA-binding protein CbpA
LGLALSGRLTEQAVKRAHKALAVQHHPDKGGDPEMMTRLNNARDLLLEPEMEAIPA